MNDTQASADGTFYGAKARIQKEAKLAVAFRAVLLLGEGDALLIDAGTSLTPMAQIIVRMSFCYPNSCHFTIMTHNQRAFDALVRSNPVARLNVFQTGGRYDSDLNASFGRQAERAYEEFDPKWVFIGQSGLDADRGLFCHGNTEELSLKQVIFSKPAFSRIILSDHGKLGIPGGLRFGESNRLRDNVEHCVLLSDDPRDAVETEDGARVERYERQISKLSDTHGVTICPVAWQTTTMSAGITRLTLKPRVAGKGRPPWMATDGSDWLEFDETGNIANLSIERYGPPNQ